jgi:hypothetical protein
MATAIKATPRVPHLTVDERAARGKAARAEVPRSSHAVFEPPRRRADPIKLLERQAKTRVPELVPIRYGRMHPGTGPGRRERRGNVHADDVIRYGAQQRQIVRSSLGSEVAAR